MDTKTASSTPHEGAASAGTATPLVEIRGVHKAFRPDAFKKAKVVLDDISLVIPEHLCTGLLGHNGAGKTTTIRLLLGLIRPDKGEVRFGGAPLTMERRRQLGYMPEVNKLPAGLTPEEVLSHQLTLFAPESTPTRERRRAAIDEALARVGLTEHRKKRLGKLSKGMARRVAWAQATIHSPKLLILDEPSSGLDPLGRRQMLDWILAEKKRGTTILLCTHELSQVATLCDEFHVLRRGRLAASTIAGLGADGDVGRLASGLSARQRWVVQVSGADNAALTRIAAEARLPAWRSLTQEGFLAVLRFDAYEPTAQWVQTLLARGLVVTRSGDEGFVVEDDVLKYFDGGA